MPKRLFLNNCDESFGILRQNITWAVHSLYPQPWSLTRIPIPHLFPTLSVILAQISVILPAFIEYHQLSERITNALITRTVLSLTSAFICWLLICVFISRIDVCGRLYVDTNIYILVTWVITNIPRLSPTDFVSNIRHQHRCSLRVESAC